MLEFLNSSIMTVIAILTFIGVYKYLYNRWVMDSEAAGYECITDTATGFSVSYSANMRVLVTTGFAVSVAMLLVSVIGVFIGIVCWFGYDLTSCLQFGILSLVLGCASGVVDRCRVLVDEKRVTYISVFGIEKTCEISSITKVTVVTGGSFIFYSGRRVLFSMVFNPVAVGRVTEWSINRGIKVENIKVLSVIRDLSSVVLGLFNK